MNSQNISDEVLSAFRDVPCPQDSVSPATIDASNAIEAVDDMLGYSAEVTKYDLPRLMCAGISMAEVDVRDRLLCRLICFFDVEFFDPEGNYDLVREIKRQRFSSFSNAQCAAIHKWLECVKSLFELSEGGESLASASKYWKARCAI